MHLSQHEYSLCDFVHLMYARAGESQMNYEFLECTYDYGKLGLYLAICLFQK